MARTGITPEDAGTPGNQPQHLHAPRSVSLVVFLYMAVFISIFLVIMYILKKFLAPLNLRAAINVAKAHRLHKHRPDSQAYRPNMATMGLYGHTGEIVFTESYKKQGLYNLRFILGASVEILGRGSLGNTYKVILRDGSIIALKRLKEISLKQKDFEQHMGKLGRLHIEDIVPVQSYYHSKGLTFVAYDYMCLGSLSCLLQVGKECNHTPLEWSTRLAIAIGVARELNCLHSNSMVHGNLKSNNIFLQIDFTPMLSEYGLVQISLPTYAIDATLGYKAPELTDASAPDYTSDVYSFGVLLMELLTGKSPRSFADRHGESIDTSTSLYAADLPEWVAKISHEKQIGDVFDPELSPASFEATLVQMLHVAMACVSALVDSRPSMSLVARMMEDIKYIQEKGINQSVIGKALSDSMSDAESQSSLALLLRDEYTCSDMSITTCLKK